MKRVVAQTGLYLLATLALRAMPLITLPLLTHALAPEEYGRLEFLTMLAELGGLLAGGGLAAVVFRFATVGPAPERRQAGAEAIGLALVLAALATLVALGLGQVLHLGRAVGAGPLELAVVTLSFGVAAFVETPLAVLRAEDRVRLFTVLTILRALVQTALLALFLWAGAGVAGALAAALLTSSGLAAFLLADRRGRGGVALPRAGRLGAYASYGLPMLGAGLVGFVQMAADRWIVAWSLGTEALALYALAVKIAIVTTLLLRPYDMWWEANRMQLMTGGAAPGAAWRARAAGMGLSVLAGIGMALLGGALIRLATPEAFHGAIGLVPIAAAAGALHAASAYAGARLFVRPSGLPVFYVNLGCAVLTLAACLLMVPRWGLEGALWARLAGAGLRILGFAFAAWLCRPHPREPAAEPIPA